MLNDQSCEKRTFSFLYLKRKFGYKIERDIKLSPTIYFN